VAVLCQLNCVILKVSFFCTLGVAGILEMGSIGERRRPGHGPAERLSGPVAAPLRGFFCRPLSGSLFWRTFLSMLWPRRRCFLQISSMAGVLETSPIGERRRPGHDPAERLSGQVVVPLRGFFCRTSSGSLFWRTFFGMLWPGRRHFFADFEHGWRPRDEPHWGETPAWPPLVCLLSLQLPTTTAASAT